MFVIVALISLAVALTKKPTEYASWYHNRFRIYTPLQVDESKTYDLILFFTGFQSLQPPETYEEILAGWATTGNQAVVVAWNGLGISNVEAPIKSSIKFMTDHFPFVQYGLDDFLGLYLEVKPRFSLVNNVYLAGHSAGNRLVALLSQQIPNKGLIMLDPVDKDPLKLTPSILTNPYPYTHPIFIMTTRLGTQKGSPISPPCVTPGAGVQFYSAFPNASRYMIEAVDYGHADLLSPDWLAWGVGKTGFCKSTDDQTVHPYKSLKQFVVKSVKQFLDVGLVDERTFGINVVVYNQTTTE